ncbi:DUF1330 domain-containing protein [Sphingomonas sp. BK580]|uniref:DUF1330 domain-containing protein n=1 Tax=Sphingomonas sp. BK580 TaxID=2586972 RepID=UPI00160F4498|nr:DUF1330 domain-containing protein [Sphingomonas sp. BK580]MBB3692849.1 hypothetical protein [Sphingomonas sp. BK580]
MTNPLIIPAAPLDAAELALDEAPLLMVNLLRFHDEARYDPGDGHAPCSGREAYYDRYVAIFRQLTAGQAIAPEWRGSVGAAIVGADGEAWDEVVIVRYPSVAAFRAIVDAAAYREIAAPHRRAALADWRLIATTPAPLAAGANA